MSDSFSDTPHAQNAYYRPRFSLNGAWGYIVDPYETGYRNHRDWRPFDEAFHPSDRTFFEDARPVNAWDRIEYDFRVAPKMQVPGDWFHQVEELRYYEGSVWLHRDFEYELREGKRLFLRFEAANYETDVYINGESLGRHTGGFDPFEFEITRFLHGGANSLIVRVNNRREKNTVPGMATDWWNYGGITRDVYLFETPACYLRDYHFQLQPGKGDIGLAEFWLDGAEEGVELGIEIPALGIDAKAFADENGYARTEVSLSKAQRWSPETPKLYEVRFTAGEDQVQDLIGFRTIETRGADVLLNDEPIFLRGISIHEEVASVPRRAHSRADAQTLLKQAVELNCNFVRLAHYPHNEHMLRLADEMGLLVWEEIPVYWGIDYENPVAYESALSQLRSVVHRDRNRASVIVWSVANETPVTESRLAFLGKLKSTVRKLDSHRLVSAALDRTQSEDKRVLSLQDPFVHESDLMSCNQYLGWYYGMPDDCAVVSWDLDPDKPFFISEFGAGALAGRHGPKEEVWTEEYQAWVYEQQLAMLEKVSNFRGCSPWILQDFRSPRRNLSGVQDHWNRKGLLAPDGRKKKAFHVLKAFYDRIESTYRKESETSV